jgi:hypothetical protein
VAAIVAACGKDDSLGNNRDAPLDEKGTGGASATTGGAGQKGGSAPTGGKGSGGASKGSGGATGGAVSSGGKDGGGGAGDCTTIQCIRAIECVEECGGPVMSSGCCPCPGGTFDQIECMTGEGGADGNAGTGNSPAGGPGTGGTDPIGNAGAGGAGGGDVILDVNDAIADESTQGTGDCAGKTLGAVIDAIHLANRKLEDITVLYDPQDPLIGPAFILAFTTPDGFRLVFMRGSGDCPAGCINREYWYFETNAACEPVQIGHYARGQGNGCTAVSGKPMWGQPAAGNVSNACPPPDFDELNASCVDDLCPDGLTPTFFYGLAGTSGPRFCWCSIACDHSVDLCPDGTRCTDIGDGPANICYAQ